MNFEIKDFVGFIMPPFIDLLNKYIQNTKVRFWASIALSIVVAVLLNLNEVNQPGTLLVKAAFVFAQAQIVYKQYWEKSDARATLLGPEAKNK